MTSPNTSELIVRLATPAEMIGHHGCALNSVGWKPMLIDAQLFSKAESCDAIIAYHKNAQPQQDGSIRSEDILGYATVHCAGTSAGYLGHFIVRPDVRRLGIGNLVFDAALEHLKDCDTVGLEAVAEMESYYAKKGFTRVYESSRLVNTITAEEQSSTNTDTEVDELLKSLGDQIEIVDCKSYIEDIVSYDTEASGLVRPGHIRELVLMSSLDDPRVATTTVALRCRRLNKIVAFGAIRHGSGRRARLAPLYADTPELATTAMRLLLHNYYQRFGNEAQNVFLAAADVQPHYQRIMTIIDQVSRQTRWKSVAEFNRTVAMWTNGCPKNEDLSKLYFSFIL
ncbi:hypothetical protein GQ42DRAFT_21558 [Ramicandelaber brevisporus]|nr:hypothetical protein GQ42DRAFT_21558 [Ramicandelaber brevisporus]